MKCLLSIMDSYFCVFGSGTGKKSGSEFEFHTSGNLVVEFDFGVESVDSGLTLGQADSSISVFPLEFS